MVDSTALVLRAAAQALGAGGRLVLAVSGGRDSMVLLDAMRRCAEEPGSVTVATFDHGTGVHARAAADLVEDEVSRSGFALVRGRSLTRHLDEASLRAARWGFLRRVAHERAAAVVTAHHRDDQVETVAMRVLRGAGMRGLAGLRAASATLRPFADVPRDVLARYADSRSLRWVHDPANDSMAYLRNRVRHQLLPALRQVWRGADDELWRIGEEAASLRARVEHDASRWLINAGPGRARVSAALLAEVGPQGRALAWPALLSAAGIVLDRRGVGRLAALDAGTRTGARIPLSGGFEVVRHREFLVVDRQLEPAAGAESIPLASGSRFGRFRFVETGRAESEPSWWVAGLPDEPHEVRAWQGGDRVRADGARPARRVSRFLAEARILAPDRRGWPVVVQGGEIIWVPGACAARVFPTAPERALRYFQCEHVPD